MTTPDIAYEAAARAYCAEYAHGDRDDWVAAREVEVAKEPWLRAIVDTAWPLAVAEGRRQAAEAIRAGFADVAVRAVALAGVPPEAADGHPVVLAGEWAARLAEGGDGDHAEA